MDELISKELYLKVAKHSKTFTWSHFTPETIDDFELILNNFKELQVWEKDGGIVAFENIYELAHKCKEWAELQHGYTLISYQKGSVGNCEIAPIGKFFGGENEIEAIVAACEWILNNA